MNDADTRKSKPPFDGLQATKEQNYYQKMAKISRFYARLKRTKVLHKERINDESATIYTANHIGSYDQFFISLLLDKTPLHYLVKDKVTTWPLRWNLIYKPTGVVVVASGKPGSWEQAKEKLVQYLRHGNSAFIFAEGSRRGENNIGDFKPGIVQVAQEAGVSVKTLAIKNTSKFLLKNPIVCAGETVSIGPEDDLRATAERIKAGVVSAYNEILAYEKSVLNNLI